MNIRFHRNFKKKFQKLTPKIQEKFYSRLEIFINNSFAEELNNHPVEKVFPNCRSINITGDYRAIFKQLPDETIFVIIGTHSELYS